MKKIISILLFSLSAIFCHSQSIQVNGKLILENEEDRDSIINKTKVILKQNDKEQSFIVNDKLEFFFQIDSYDDILITTIPKSIGNIVGRTFMFKDSEKNIKNSIALDIPYALTCKYDKSKDINICPTCNKSDLVIPYTYGLVVMSNDAKENYKLGGCVVSECDPNWYCKRDNLDF